MMPASRMLALLTFAVVALQAGSAFGQTTEIEKLFQALENEQVQPQAAMREFLDTTPLKNIDAESFNTISSNLQVMKAKIGDVLDSELVQTKQVGSSVTIYKYLLKGENSVSVWTFIYYRPPTTNGAGSAAQLLHVAFQTDVLALDEIVPTEE